MCARAPYSSPPLRLELFSFILLHAQAAPGPAKTAARCPGGGARPAAGTRGRRDGPGSAPGSGDQQSPPPVRCPAPGGGGGRTAPGSTGAPPRGASPEGFSRPRAQRGPAGTSGATSRGRVPRARRSLRGQSWVGGLYFAPGQRRSVDRGRETECLVGFKSPRRGGDPTGSAGREACSRLGAQHLSDSLSLNPATLARD